MPVGASGASAKIAAKLAPKIGEVAAKKAASLIVNDIVGGAMTGTGNALLNDENAVKGASEDIVASVLTSLAISKAGGKIVDLMKEKGVKEKLENAIEKTLRKYASPKEFQPVKVDVGESLVNKKDNFFEKNNHNQISQKSNENIYFDKSDNNEMSDFEKLSYIERVQKRTRKPIQVSKQEWKKLETNIYTYQFSENEIKNGYAIRYTDNYSYLIQINDIENLDYSIIKKWSIE